MDELDSLLLGAYHRAARRLREDPAFAACRRARFTRSAHLQKPLRAFCLVLRASDHRLWQHSVPRPDDAHLYKLPHELRVDREGLAALVAPVRLPFPGMRHRHAAALLGIDVAHIANWIRRKALHVRYDHPNYHESRGKPVPAVYASHALDPNSRFGLPPDPLWANTWQRLIHRVPASFNQWLTRRPRYGTRLGRDVFRGWLFTCPGRWRPVPPGSPIPRVTLDRLRRRHEALRQWRHNRAAHPDDHYLQLKPLELLEEDCDRPPLLSSMGEYDMRYDPTAAVSASAPASASEGGGDPRLPTPIDPADPPLRFFRRMPCGRQASRLYMPVPVLTVQHYLGETDATGSPLPVPSTLDGLTNPPLENTGNTKLPVPSSPFPDIHPRDRTFACKQCWQPVYTKHTDAADLWNLFITHITGGMLTGRDVPRPHEATVRKRRHREYTHRK